MYHSSTSTGIKIKRTGGKPTKSPEGYSTAGHRNRPKSRDLKRSSINLRIRQLNKDQPSLADVTGLSILFKLPKRKIERILE